jgi:tRNA threonylcarbamoyladenosine biosynthesis protein TsaE
MLSYSSNSSADTKKLGLCLGKFLPANSLLFLRGNLGAGKTTLVQGIAKGLGVVKKINSPTFNIIKEYSLPKRPNCSLVHIDAYRIKSAVELINLGIQDSIFQNNFVVIEWAENISKNLPNNHILITLTSTSPKTRLLQISFPASAENIEQELLKKLPE